MMTTVPLHCRCVVMGVTTQYLRYVPGPVFGLVGTGRCVRLVTRFSQVGKFLAVSACERVLIWDLRREAKVGGEV